MIGVTGGIGSGKSSVARRFSFELGCNLLSADNIAADLLSRPGSTINQLRNIIGDGFFFDDGSLDRAKLRVELFADSDLRKEVDALLHPLIREVLNKEANRLEIKSGRPVVAEIPLLYEAGWQKECSAIVVVYAAPLICLQRLIQRDGVTSSEAAKAFGAQLPIGKKALWADYVIDNSGPWLETYLQIKRLAMIIGAKSS